MSISVSVIARSWSRDLQMSIQLPWLKDKRLKGTASFRSSWGIIPNHHGRILIPRLIGNQLGNFNLITARSTNANRQTKPLGHFRMSTPTTLPLPHFTLTLFYEMQMRCRFGSWRNGKQPVRRMMNDSRRFADSGLRKPEARAVGHVTASDACFPLSWHRRRDCRKDSQDMCTEKNLLEEYSDLLVECISHY